MKSAQAGAGYNVLPDEYDVWRTWVIRRLQQQRSSLRASKWWFLGATICVPAIALLVASSFITIGATRAEGNLIAELVLGLCFLMGGAFLFGFRALGFRPPHFFSKFLLVALFPLMGIMLLNGWGGQFTALNIGQVNLLEVSITGFWEETVFRGFLLAVWIRFFGIEHPVSRLSFLAMSAFLFGIIHPNQGAELFFRSGLGLMFAMVLIYTQSVYIPMLLHALNNALIIGSSADETVKITGFVVLYLVSILLVLRVPKSTLNSLRQEMPPSVPYLPSKR